MSHGTTFIASSNLTREGDALDLSIDPDDSIGLDSDNVDDAITELAGDTNTLKERLNGLFPISQLPELP